MDNLQALKEFVNKEPSPGDSEIKEFIKHRLEELDDNTEEFLNMESFNGSFGMFKENGRI